MCVREAILILLPNKFLLAFLKERGKMEGKHCLNGKMQEPVNENGNNKSFVKVSMKNTTLYLQ